MIKKRLILHLTIISLLGLIPAFAAPVGELPEVGKAAPEFSLKTDAGKDVNLKDYRGKWVVLYFYPKDFTSGCTVQARNFQKDLAAYQQANAVILGVSVDTVESHKGFCEKEGLNFTLLADTETKVSASYGSLNDNKLSARNTFIIDPEGKVVKVFPKVSVAKHSEEVLAALAELQKK
ncbi:MAG TPA: peroxiredoxin [Blastocatellia bacterium]|nr:peroxiredoxin [Blastocatellia bacterium]